MLRPLGLTAILVTHDREEAFSFADRIALMRDGAIVQAGTPEELYYAPATRWAAEFVGACNVLPGTVRRRMACARPSASSRRTAPPMPAARSRCSCDPSSCRSSPIPNGRGEVVAREFRGHDVFYRVLVDGNEILSQRPSNEIVPLGARVSLDPPRRTRVGSPLARPECSVRFALHQIDGEPEQEG